MSTREAMKATPAVAGRDLRELDRAGRQITSLATPQKIALQVIRAEIVGEDRSEAEGLSARGVLALCRSLIAAGFDSARPLHAYRGGAPCLKVRSLRAGAALTVKERPFGPVFEIWTPFPTPPVAASTRETPKPQLQRGGAR